VGDASCIAKCVAARGDAAQRKSDPRRQLDAGRHEAMATLGETYRLTIEQPGRPVGPSLSMWWTSGSCFR
jgi:hypothetical protein